MHWNCEICGKRRPDHLIDVAKHILSMRGEGGRNLGMYERNVKFCTDNPKCRAAAQDSQKFGG